MVFLYPKSKYMEKGNLPFLLGLDYEQWEFSLEVLNKEDILGMDNYLYLEDISFLGVVPKSVEMLFSLDILQVVRIIYEFDNQKELDKFYKGLAEYFKNNIKLLYKDKMACLIEDIEIWIIPKSDCIEVVYGTYKHLIKLME